MANRNSPQGFWPVRHLTGGVIRANEYDIVSGLASNIYTGDPVKTSPGTTKRIDVAAATNVIRGVFGGVKYVNAQGDIKFSRYWASGTTLATGEVAKALVYDDPNILFGVQCDGTLTATMIGQLIEFDFSTAGSAATGLSGCQADIANVGSAKTLYIYELLPIIGNAYGANAKIGVLIDKHELLTRAAVAT